MIMTSSGKGNDAEAIPFDIVAKRLLETPPKPRKKKKQRKGKT